MQWLIDIIAAQVISTIGIPPTFIYRGDNAVPDFAIGDLTTDATWRALDLSAIIPTNATAIDLNILTMANAVSKSVLFKPNLTAGTANQAGFYTQVANQTIQHNLTLPIDQSRTIYYNIAPAVWPFLSISINGWWL